MTPNEKIALGAGVALAAGVGIYLALGTDLFSFRETAPARRLFVGAPLNSDQMRAAFVTSNKWHPAPANTDGLREVPITGLQWTPLSDLHTRFGRGVRASSSNALFLSHLAACRAALQATGRGDEDPRSVLFLWELECGWGTACWGWNLGNRKLRPYATPAGIRAGHVLVHDADAVAVQLLIDRVLSFDGYGAFASYEDGVRVEKAFFERNAGLYGPRGGAPGVLDGYRRGGLEGLLDARTAMHRGGYSPGVLSRKLNECRSYWARGQRMCGAAWVR